ncbi:hypothetical protein ACEPAG_785 [Sanghuangporus baumii]
MKRLNALAQSSSTLRFNPPSWIHASLRALYTFQSIFTLTSLVALPVAHYSISHTEPRGVYVSDNQNTFCNGNTNAAGNRSDFLLSNGLIKLDNHHTEWAASVFISTDQSPTNFSAFNTSLSGVQLPFAVDWFSSTGSGEICIPIDIASLNIEGVSDGSNVTLQTMFTGGHNNLYQCVDVTLRAYATVSSNVTCECTVNSTIDTTMSSTPDDEESEDSGAERLSITSSELLGVAVAFLLL